MEKFYNLEAFLSEYVLVKQHTAVGRVKRDTGGYDVAFPAQMSFTIGFRNKEYSLDMLRNIHMTSNPAIFTKDGQRPNSTVSLEPLILVLACVVFSAHPFLNHAQDVTQKSPDECNDTTSKLVR